VRLRVEQMFHPQTHTDVPTASAQLHQCLYYMYYTDAAVRLRVKQMPSFHTGWR
jgi:hypothetical protein